ncbi:MAG: hypothetical protein LBH95_09840 [Oscillospiraceae bacterium]|jgi:hypothetical protein|nr:hypothetical protein [Oscillospiraceae bacterium]
MDRRWAVVITLFFFLPLAGLGLYSVRDGDAAVSEDENRPLAQKPPFSLSALFGGRWTGDFDEYYADQFPGRDALMSASRRFEQWLYIPLKDGSAVIGGEFDLGGGESLEDILGQLPSPGPDTPSPSPSPRPSPSPSPVPSPSPSPEPEPEPSPEPSPSPTPEPVVDAETNGYLIIGDRIMHMSYTNKARLEIYANMLGRLQDALPDRRVVSMVVPNSFPFYAPSAYTQSSRDQRQMIEDLYALYDPRIAAVDGFTPIAAHKDEYLFYRTDHHWTARGAYWAYTGFCDTLGYEPSDIETWERGEYEGFIGSFYREVRQHPQAAAAADHPDTVEYFVPPGEYTATAYGDASMKNGWSIPVVNTNLPNGASNKYVCFTNGDQALIHISTDNKNGKSIAVVKESYGNALIPFLLAHYENIYVFDYRKYNREDLPKCKLADFVTGHDIDDVLLISYPYVPNEKGFTGWIELMMP